jgi:hypothetical protein
MHELQMVYTAYMAYMKPGDSLNSLWGERRGFKYGVS